jgi:hypothetical protein
MIEDDGIQDSGIYVFKHSFSVPLNVLSVPRDEVSVSGVQSLP